MKKFSCDRYFPRELDYSSEQRAQFLRLEQTLVRETLDEYAEYRTLPLDPRASVPMLTSVLDPLEWKAVHQEGDLTIYKERKKAHANNDWYTRMQKTLRRPSGDVAVVEAKWPIPTLLMHGTIRGRLNDTMYGAFADSDNGFRLRTGYLDDGLDDSKILHTFERASLEDPFRFCGLVWYVYGQSFGPLVRRRDSVLLVATGTTTSKEGDRIGYTILHSVDIPELRPLKQYKIERAYGSLVFIKRQLDDQRVEMFQKGFFTPMGDLPDFATLQSVIKGLLRAGNATIEASLNKKLVWMMQDAVRLRRQSVKPCDESPFAPSSNECGGGCKSRLSVNSSRGTCMICRKLVCSNCKVNRKLTLEATVDGLIQKTLCFCALCVTIARNTSALTIATREFVEKDTLMMASSFRSTRSHGSSNSGESDCEPTVDFAASFRSVSSSMTRKAHVLWTPES